MRKMSIAQIRRLLKKLPSPDVVYTTPSGTVFEMYRVRDLHGLDWRNPVLAKLLLQARTSYFRYGYRAPLDQYDQKAATYLIRVIYKYPARDITAEEWLSIRMAPGDGEPIGGGELEIYYHRGEPIDELVKKKFFAGWSDSFWRYIVSSSRMCGISPYPAEGAGIELGPKHCYTALCFALIHIQFVIDYSPRQFPYRYVTAIIRDELVERGLKLIRGDKILRPLFTPAYQLLGLPDRDKIKLNKGVYAYEFPSYWFDVSQLTALLERLRVEGKISASTIRHYLNAGIRSRKGLQRLGRLLTVDGPIIGSELTGQELRALVDSCVADKPELKITEYGMWNGALILMLEAGGIGILSQHPWFREFL